MTRLVTVSRAAKLAGVSRGNLQKQIREGAITSFEGMVDLEQLARGVRILEEACHKVSNVD